ncbi:hypothetical protein ACJMK2_003878 [Sinanodonta woodiana]|uniref:G-protein coupled receptors family 1 profile domain-containing protein n=1 Tax=Sinanodonta woodiana TaxID=1069815 RepID=A0ABD3XZI6_SINWO
MDEPFNATKLSLEELNQNVARKNLGGVIFVSILMVIGLIGNVHILYVYAFKFKSSNIRTFILWLGTIDLLVCLVGMPFIIYDLTHPLLFFATNVCKALRYFDYIMSFSSASTLILISIERYRKICVPLGRQLTLRMSKIACVCVLLFAICVSWPALVLYGHTTVETENRNITGVQCYTDDRYKMTPYQTYFNIFLVGLISLMLVVMIILYLFMGRTLFEHLRFRAHFKRRFRSKRYFCKTDSISNGSPVQSISHLVEENITSKFCMKIYAHILFPQETNLILPDCFRLLFQDILRCNEHDLFKYLTRKRNVINFSILHN